MGHAMVGVLPTTSIGCFHREYPACSEHWNMPLLYDMKPPFLEEIETYLPPYAVRFMRNIGQHKVNGSNT